MKTCPLCLQEKQLIKNTHYLSDFIIKTALNEKGSTERDKTLSFDISSDTPFTKVNFKSATNPEKLEEVFGREPTDEEIQESIVSSQSFAVDNVFCQDCEDKFSEIEDKFSSSSIIKIRYNKAYEEHKEIEVEEVGLFRLFWLLQVWRSSVCTDLTKLSPGTKEKLRLIILSGIETNEDDLKQFPLAVTFLYTGEDKTKYDTNIVGSTSDKTPFLIQMNDFMVQFYEDEEDVRFFDYYGLNHKKDYLKYINLNEDVFLVKVLSDQRRKAFLDAFYLNEKVIPTLKYLTEYFYKEWAQATGYFPLESLMKEYRIAVTTRGDIPLGLHLDQKRIEVFTKEFISEKRKLYGV